MGSLKAAPAPPAAPPQQKDVTNAMNSLKRVLSPAMVQSVNAVYSFSITDAHPSEWYVDLKSGDGQLGSGKVQFTFTFTFTFFVFLFFKLNFNYKIGAFNGKVDCTLTMTTDVFNQVVSGSLKPSAAFMTGKLKIKGNMGLAMKLEKLMGSLKSKL